MNEDIKKKCALLCKGGVEAEKVARELVNAIKPSLLNLIKKGFSIFRGDAENIANEAITEGYLRLIKQCSKEDFEINNGTLEGYYFGICKWYLFERGREQKKTTSYEDIEKLSPKLTGYDPEESHSLIAGGKTLDELLTKLGGQCEEVLRYRYEFELTGKSKRSICDVVKWFKFTEAYARKRISDCRAKLGKLKL